MKRVATMMLVLVIALVATAWSHQQSSINEVCSAVADGTVVVDNLAGTVEVSGWERAEVEVTGTLSAQAQGLSIDQHGNLIRIEVEIPEHIRNLKGSHLKVKVPSASRVEVDTVSADISVTAVTGALELESVSGRVDISGRPARIEAESVSGSITVETAINQCELASVSGTVKVLEATGDLEVENVSGNIVIKSGSLSRGDLNSVSGSVHCQTTVTGHGSLKIESMSGNVTLAVPADTAAGFKLSTFSGSITNQLGPTPKSSAGAGKEVKFSTGNGPKVILSSFSGSLELLSQ